MGSQSPAAGAIAPNAVPIQVQLLGGFSVRRGGRPVALAGTAQRLLALLAVRATPHARSTVAATLWPDTPDARAAANLRTALWRVRQALGPAIDPSEGRLSLAPHVEVDLHRLRAIAARILDATDDVLDLTIGDLPGDLLPDWYDEWIVYERERARQQRIHALEALARRLIASERLPAAIDTALAAVASEPLRESAQRLLIEAHLGEGNVSEARRQFQAYRILLAESLGLEPSIDLQDLVSNGDQPVI